MTPATGFVIYRGPSLLDGNPIVAVALTSRSRNSKTGPMVQTYILRSDIDPVRALRSGGDVSICGDCKHRPFNGGACYVNVGHGPSSVYRKLKRRGYPRADAPDDIAALGKGRMVRLGTYGDPMAVPARVWQALVSHASGHTGYTHQWQNPRIPATQWRAVLDLCMASADSETEAVQARDARLRYFRVTHAELPPGSREFVCPASAEAGKRTTCAACGACNGSRPGTELKASPVIVVHGVRSRRFAQQSPWCSQSMRCGLRCKHPCRL